MSAKISLPLESSWNRWRLVVAIFVALALALPAFAARKTIDRRFPGGPDFRPLGPFYLPGEAGQPGQLVDAIDFVAPDDGIAEITIGAATCQRGFHIDNVVVLKTSEFLSEACGELGNEPCSVVDTKGCYSANLDPYNSVKALVFDAADPPPPPQLALFETFESGVPSSWRLEGAYWDGRITAPSSVVSDPVGEGIPVCREGTQGGSLALEPGARVKIPLTGLEPGEKYLLQVWWGTLANNMIGDGGEALYFDVPGGVTPPEPPTTCPVLLVDDDDNNPPVQSSYTEALTSLGVDFVLWDTGNSDSNEPNEAEFKKYSTVIWFSGGAFGDPPPGFAGPGSTSEILLSNWLFDSGGCFLLSSQDYLFDHDLDPDTSDVELTFFMKEYLGLGSVNPDITLNSVVGTGPFRDIGPSSLTFPFDDFSDELFPDLPTGPAFFDAESAGSVVTAVANTGFDFGVGVGRTTFLAFPLEALPVLDQRRALADFLAWCEGDPILSVDRKGTGTGAVTSNPGGINCGGDCYEQYPRGTEVTLTALPGPESIFAGWRGGGCSGRGACVVNLEEPTAVIATFNLDLPDVRLQVRRDGTGSGSVTSDPAGIDCGASCTEEFPAGTEVTLTATPSSDSRFVGWTGSGCTGVDPCVLTLTENAVVTATFDFDGPTLTVTPEGTGSGTVISDPAGIDCGNQCAQAFASGTQVTLTATPAPDSIFAGWSGGGCSGIDPCVLTLNEDTTVSAVFLLAPEPTLSVLRDGSGSGTVTSMPAGIDCGVDCDEAYPSGTQITLTATPDALSTLTGWSGGGCVGTSACVLTLTEDTAVTATFERDDLPDPTLTVVRDGMGTVTSTPAGIDCGSECGAQFPFGTDVNLTATADPGWIFRGWIGGGCSGTDVCQLTLTEDTQVDADFVEDDCPGALCLNGERFQVDVTWRTPQGETGVAQAAPGVISDDSGVLYFFSQNNWEMLIKVLDGCSINNHFWVFAAATTDVEYEVTVTDRETKFSPEPYRNEQGNAAASITDITALPVCDANVSSLPKHKPKPSRVLDLLPKLGNCVETATNLCLNRGRFQVEVEWMTVEGTEGIGSVVPFGSDDSGLLYFFSANNWEMLIKVLDGCSINSRFWVLAAATTDVGYRLKVTDTLTGVMRSYENRAGQAAQAIIETGAFATCDAADEAP